MLERIKALEAAGAWGEIRQHAPALLAGLVGDELARGYLGTSKAFEETATCPDDYRAALAHTRSGLEAATPGGLMHSWLLHRLAVYCADLGDYSGAERAAERFFAALPNHPAAEGVAPWASYALGRALAGRRKYGAALRRYQDVLDSAAPDDLKWRAQLGLVWAYALAGRVAAATLACPDQAAIPDAMQANLQAARALLLAKAGRWHDAYEAASGALRAYTSGASPVFDIVEAAELCAILREASVALGRRDLAQLWRLIATNLLSWRGDHIMTRVALTLQARGGEYIDAAASHRGPAGHKCTGARGAVG